MECIRFHNIPDLPSRRELDKFAPISEKFVRNCQYAYSFGDFVTLYKKLEHLRSKFPFLKFIPSHCVKYG